MTTLNERNAAISRLQNLAIQALNLCGGDPGNEAYWRQSVLNHALTRSGHKHVIEQDLEAMQRTCVACSFLRAAFEAVERLT